MADDASRLERLLSSEEPKIRDAFLNMVGTLKSNLDLGELADLIENGQLEEALASALRSIPKNLEAAVMDTYITAARSTAESIGRSLGEIIIDFDVVNDGAVSAMRANNLRLVQGFTSQQTQATRAALLDGIERGVNPRDMARVFRDSIGLTAKQQQAVMNYRNSLLGLDRDALNRGLRDRRFDSTVERAIRDGNPLSAAQVQRMTERYRERMLKYRAEVIARTEALRSVHEGAQAMYDQAIGNGDLRADQLIRTWNTARDERVRPSHQTMDGQERGYDEPFVSGKGALLMFPGDSRAPAEETIQCRCVVSTRITSLEV